MQPTKLKTEVRQEAGYYSLYVNGRRTIDRESFAVCDRVRDALEHPERHAYSEAADVAASIRKWCEQ